MKRPTIKSMRALAGAAMACIVVLAGAVCFFSKSGAITVSSAENAPAYFGNRESNNVALMFNCYENSEIIEKIAEVLEKNGARATFFVGGCFIKDKPELIARLLSGGHELGNHGYFHKNHSKLSKESNLSEIKNTHSVVKALGGGEMYLFAPPSGDFSKTTLECAKSLGYKTIMWSKDTIDWRDKNAEIVLKRATSNVRGGDFVLMHPKEHTLSALEKILEYYKNAGLNAVTVSECLQ